MKYYGNISDNKDLVDKKYVDDINSGIANSLIKKGSFTITEEEGKTVPVTVTINHGIETKYLNLSLYKERTIEVIEDNEPRTIIVLNSVMCDYYISSVSPYKITLTLTSRSDLEYLAGTYHFIIIGSSLVESSISSISITKTVKIV